MNYIKSLYLFKSRIKNKYNHDLKIVEINSDHSVYRSEVNKAQTYFWREYIFKCKLCNIYVMLFSDKYKIHYEKYYFFYQGKEMQINYYKCNEYMIKGILE